eukprot:scaffold1735_cov119-Isochrysis_galbana.AAC.1
MVAARAHPLPFSTPKVRQWSVSGAQGGARALVRCPGLARYKCGFGFCSRERAAREGSLEIPIVVDGDLLLAALRLERDQVL